MFLKDLFRLLLLQAPYTWGITGVTKDLQLAPKLSQLCAGVKARTVIGSNGTGSSIPSSQPKCQLLHLLIKLHILFSFPITHCNSSKVQSRTTLVWLCSYYLAALAHHGILLPKSPLQSALHGLFPSVLCCGSPQWGRIEFPTAFCLFGFTRLFHNSPISCCKYSASLEHSKRS